MASNDFCLQHIKASGPAEFVRDAQRLQSPPDLQLVPEGAVLVAHQDGFTGSIRTRSRP